MAIFYPVDGEQHPNRISHYQRSVEELLPIFEENNIPFPGTLHHVSKFERAYNERNPDKPVSINVYGAANNKIYILHISDNHLSKRASVIDLLYLSGNTITDDSD